MTKEEIKNKLLSLNKDTNQEEIINLRGKLISLLKKEIASSSDLEQKKVLEEELSKEIEEHKQQTTSFKETKKLTIPQKVGQKIKEIANTIKTFKENPNLFTIFKNTLKSTAQNSIIIAAISLLIAASNHTISLKIISSLIPTISYVGLSNLFRNIYKDKLSKEEMQSNTLTKETLLNLKDYLVENTHLEELISSKEKNNDNNSLIEINEEILKEYNALKEKFPNKEITHLLAENTINIMEELKECYETKKLNYIKNKEILTPSEFANLEKKILQLDIDLFKEENYLQEAGENAFKNIKINTVTMYLARLLLQSVFPTLSFKNINDLVTPFFLVVLNNIVNIFNFKDKIKLKKSKYDGKVIKFNDNSLFNSLSNKENIQYA